MLVFFQLIVFLIVNGKILLTTWEKYLNNDKQIRWLDMWLCTVLECWMEENNIEG